MRMDQGDHRDQLLAMAATWDDLAEERAALVRAHPELATEAERAEEGGEAAD
jgi:2-oxo-4-hydroxy-4-carboxy--5-ureidoimidazoline (OHCU) decarboxylase